MSSRTLRKLRRFIAARLECRQLLTLLWPVDDTAPVQAAFAATVLKQVATEIRNITAEYRGVVSEDAIDFVARQSSKTSPIQGFRSLCPCSSAGLRVSDYAC
jgi:hypothetical protein